MPAPTQIGGAPGGAVARLAFVVLLVASGACHDGTGPDAASTVAQPETMSGDWTSVSVGGITTCALDRAGAAFCWGYNFQGMLGVGDTAYRVTVPTRVVGLPESLRAIAVGGWFNCALTAGGAAWCWGIGRSPAPLPGGLTFRSLTVGGEACGVTEGGDAYCWNAESYSSKPPVPVPGGLRFHQVSVGRSHGCGITDDAVAYCWGHNSDGELGDPTVPVHCDAISGIVGCFRSEPVAVAGGLRFMQIEAGAGHSCALTTTGKAYCWGLDTRDPAVGAGALGNGAYLGGYGSPRPHGSRVPVPVEGGLTLREIAVGNGVSCGLTSGDRAVCWGDNNFGQLGIGGPSVGASTRPRAVLMPAAASAPRPSDEHACALGTTGRIWCWGGGNFFGELGSLPLGVSLSSSGVRYTPKPVDSPAAALER